MQPPALGTRFPGCPSFPALKLCSCPSWPLSPAERKWLCRGWKSREPQQVAPWASSGVCKANPNGHGEVPTRCRPGTHEVQTRYTVVYLVCTSSVLPVYLVCASGLGHRLSACPPVRGAGGELLRG